MHADHFLDLAGLRYLFPWAGRGSSRLPVHLPPGGTSRLDELASAISERAGFFDDAYAVDEYDPDATLTVGPLTAPFRAGPPLRAGVGCLGRDARRGATCLHRGHGTQSTSMVEFARGADVLLVEATLNDASEDDVERGHLTARRGDRPGTGRRGRGGAPCPLPAGSTAGTGSPVRRGRARGSGRPFLS